MKKEYIIKEISMENLQDAKVLDLVWKVFLEFEAYQYQESGVEEFKNYISLSSISKLVVEENLYIWGCFDQHQVIGMIAITPNAHISLLFVDKNYHHQGIARALYQRALEYYKTNTTHTTISVNSSIYAIEAYHALGFVNSDSEQLTNGIRYIPMEHTFR